MLIGSTRQALCNSAQIGAIFVLIRGSACQRSDLSLSACQWFLAASWVPLKSHGRGTIDRRLVGHPLSARVNRPAPLHSAARPERAIRRGGRAAEGTRLLSEYGVYSSIRGSNPLLSVFSRHLALAPRARRLELRASHQHRELAGSMRGPRANTASSPARSPPQPNFCALATRAEAQPRPGLASTTAAADAAADRSRSGSRPPPVRAAGSAGYRSGARWTGRARRAAPRPGGR
jgi:hypothetical protein